MQKNAICENCDVRHVCMMRIFVKELDGCLLFSKCSDKKVHGEVVFDEDMEQMHLDEEPKEGGIPEA